MAQLVTGVRRVVTCCLLMHACSKGQSVRSSLGSRHAGGDPACGAAAATILQAATSDPAWRFQARILVLTAGSCGSCGLCSSAWCGAVVHGVAAGRFCPAPLNSLRARSDLVWKWRHHHRPRPSATARRQMNLLARARGPCTSEHTSTLARHIGPHLTPVRIYVSTPVQLLAYYY